MKKIISIFMLCLFFTISSNATNTKPLLKNVEIKKNVVIRLPAVSKNSIFNQASGIFGAICTSSTVFIYQGNGVYQAYVVTICTEFTPN